jgi:hypothetical protein
MKELLLKLAIRAAAGCLLSSNPMIAQVSPTTPKTARVRITRGHYGTDPEDLSQTAKSPLRLNLTIPLQLSVCAWTTLSRGQPTTTRSAQWRPMAGTMG